MSDNLHPNNLPIRCKDISQWKHLDIIRPFIPLVVSSGHSGGIQKLYIVLQRPKEFMKYPTIIINRNIIFERNTLKINMRNCYIDTNLRSPKNLESERPSAWSNHIPVLSIEFELVEPKSTTMKKRKKNQHKIWQILIKINKIQYRFTNNNQYENPSQSENESG